MQVLPTSDQNSLNFIWALPEQLADVWRLEEMAGTKWAHPKSFFAESLQYQRLLLASDGEKPIAYLLYEIIWGNTAFLSLLKVPGAGGN